MYFTDPQVIPAHDDNIRHVLFSSIDNQQFVSVSDDRTVRFWDQRSNTETNRLTFNETPYGIEICKDKTILSICYGNNVMLYDLQTMTKMNVYNIPTNVYSSSLHPDKTVFVCGGEDFLIYKYDLKTSEKLGKYNFLKIYNFFQLPHFSQRFFQIPFWSCSLHQIFA